MKKIIITLMMTTIVSLSTTFGIDIPSRPNPPRLVNDYIGMLTPEQVSSLEAKLVAFDKQTSIQIAVVIMDDLKGEAPSDFSTEIGHTWGVGQKGLDNGIVFLVAKYSEVAKENLSNKKNGDCWIAVGYGLEE